MAPFKKHQSLQKVKNYVDGVYQATGRITASLKILFGSQAVKGSCSPSSATLRPLLQAHRKFGTLLHTLHSKPRVRSQHFIYVGGWTPLNNSITIIGGGIGHFKNAGHPSSCNAPNYSFVLPKAVCFGADFFKIPHPIDR